MKRSELIYFRHKSKCKRIKTVIVDCSLLVRYKNYNCRLKAFLFVRPVRFAQSIKQVQPLLKIIKIILCELRKTMGVNTKIEPRVIQSLFYEEY